MNGPGGGVAITPIYAYAFLLVLVVAALMAVIVVWQRSRYRAVDTTQALAADVDTGFALLTVRIEAVAPAVGAGTPAAQALADARDRLAAASRQREEAPDSAVSRVCRRMLLEGLAAVREAESLSGLPTGPPLPPPTDAPLVESPVRVAIEGAEHVALPAYAPGHPHCYSGGVFDVGEVPGGWYATPFWEELLARGAAAPD